MKKKMICALVAGMMFSGVMGNSVLAAESSHVSNENITITDEFQGQTLTMILSQGWADERLDEIVDWFEEDYGVTVDIQYVDASNYTSVLQAKLTEGECADIFWIQSDPFTIADYYTYCEDLSGSWWQDVMPEARQQSCIYDGSLYGLQLWHNSPEWLIVYNKTLLSEVGYDSFPTTYEDLSALCQALVDDGVSAPWFMAGSDGWYHQLSFFQIGGVYEEAQPGLYDALNDNTATFAGNEKMLEVLNEFKELSDNGYFGDGWISDTYTNYEMAMLDRTSAFTIQNPGAISTLIEDGSEDEFDIALIPLGDNTWYPTNSQGPTMFVYNGSENTELAKAFFSYVCDTNCLQSMLDNWSDYTNLDVTDENVQQGWSDEELEFVESIDSSKMVTPVLQVGTKYSNSAWNDFGNDMIAMCQGTMTAEEVLENMDGYRAELAATAGDEAWN
jgi:raffinose/stachyose/melibiose transport system substrate-binding protein